LCCLLATGVFEAVRRGQRRKQRKEEAEVKGKERELDGAGSSGPLI